MKIIVSVTWQLLGKTKTRATMLASRAEMVKTDPEPFAVAGVAFQWNGSAFQGSRDFDLPLSPANATAIRNAAIQVANAAGAALKAEDDESELKYALPPPMTTEFDV